MRRENREESREGKQRSKIGMENREGRYDRKLGWKIGKNKGNKNTQENRRLK